MAAAQSGVWRKFSTLISAIFFATVLLLLLAGKPLPRPVKVGVFSLPPLIFQNESGRADGFYVDLVKHIAEEENWRPEYVFASWPELLELLRRGEIDLLPCIMYSHERNVFFDFSRQSTLTLWGQLFLPLDSSVKKIEDLAGKTIALKKDEQNCLNFTTLASERGIGFTPFYYTQDEDGMKSVRNGKCAAVVASQGAGYVLAKKYKLKPSQVVFSPSPQFFAVSRGRNPDLLEAVDRYIGDWIIRPDSFYYESLQRWLGRRLSPEEYIPAWLAPVIFVLMGTGLGVILLMVLLRYQVRHKTAELQDRNARLQLLFDESIHYICELDRQGRIQQINHDFLKFLKKSFEQVDGVKLVELIFASPDTGNMSSRLTAAIGNVSYDGNEVMEADLVTCNGDRASVVISLKPISDSIDGMSAVLCEMQDVSASRKATAERELLFAAIEQFQDAVVVTATDGAVEYVNAAYEKMSAMTREEMTGKRFHFSQCAHELDERLMFQALEEQKEWSFKFPVRRDSGTVATLLCRACAIEKAGEASHYVIIMRDVSKEEEMERRLRQSQKFDAIGQLAGGIAHDFNNLLQVVIGFTGILKKKEADNAANMALLNNIVEAAERGRNLVRQLMTFSNYRKTSEQQRINVNLIVGPFVDMFRQVAGENITIQYDPAAELPQIDCDVGQIEQVMMNICVNARDAMPEGGTLTIQTALKRFQEIPPELFYRIQPGEFVEMKFADTGIGIEKDHVEHIFEPFYTTKDIGKGTGLGLANVYAIIRKHGGFIRVESLPGQGAVFMVYLPVAGSQAAMSGTLEGIALPPPVKSEFSGHTVLLCEDEDSVRELGAMILTDAGFKVLEAVDGEDSIQVFMENRTMLDLVLLDAVMPKKSGREVYRFISEKAPDMPVIFISGYSDYMLQDTPGVHVITKPYDEATLLTRIGAVLRSKDFRSHVP